MSTTAQQHCQNCGREMKAKRKLGMSNDGQYMGIFICTCGTEAIRKQPMEINV